MKQYKVHGHVTFNYEISIDAENEDVAMFLVQRHSLAEDLVENFCVSSEKVVEFAELVEE